MYCKSLKCNLSLFGATLLPDLCYFLVVIFVVAVVAETSSE